jgi:hypothetical protein
MIPFTEKKTGKTMYLESNARIQSIIPLEGGGSSIRVRVSGPSLFRNDEYIAFYEVKENPEQVAKWFA